MPTNNNRKKRRGVLLDKNFLMVLFAVLIVLVLLCAVLMGVNRSYKKDMNELEEKYSVEVVRNASLQQQTAPVIPTVGATATPVGTPYIVNTDSGDLNLRPSPGTDDDPVGEIPKGTTIYITTQTNGWGYTTYDGKSGWVNMKYLSSVSSQTTEPTVSQTAYFTGN
ncbi:MAG: SH3 domain-containing protein [Clostridia bacterium]|nr:SH3 domain-containing protein [Clostridia bacterium]